MLFLAGCAGPNLRGDDIPTLQPLALDLQAAASPLVLPDFDSRDFLAASEPAAEKPAAPEESSKVESKEQAQPEAAAPAYFGEEPTFLAVLQSDEDQLSALEPLPEAGTELTALKAVPPASPQQDKKTIASRPKPARSPAKVAQGETPRLPPPEPMEKPAVEKHEEAAAEALFSFRLAEGAEEWRAALEPAGEELLLPPVYEDAPPEKIAPPLIAAFPSILNSKVKDFVDFFQTRAGGFFHRSLARSQAYEGMMKKILREKELPEELFYLALIESGYNPQATSRAKAGGIWQFVGQTAKRFGLKVDKWVDERRDPEKSTYAAAAYLKNLYDIFNDWDLATASYNAGEGKVMKAMKKAKSQDFWEISRHRYLKKETKEYVPMFLAAVLIAQEPHKYGFSDVNYHPPLVYEKVSVPPGTSLERIARAAEIDLSELRALNPSLRRGKTPPDARFDIKLPPGKKEAFEQNFTRTRGTVSTAKQHRVRRGETLVRIARKHRVDLNVLCEMNDLSRKSRLRPGSILQLPH